jgi:hypothetical protein
MKDGSLSGITRYSPVTTDDLGAAAERPPIVDHPRGGGHILISRQPDTTRTRPAATGALQQISATNQPANAGKARGEAFVSDRQEPEKFSEPSDAVKIARLALVGSVIGSIAIVLAAVVALFKPEKEPAPPAPPAPRYFFVPYPAPAAQPVVEQPAPRYRSRPPPKPQRRR